MSAWTFKMHQHLRTVCHLNDFGGTGDVKKHEVAPSDTEFVDEVYEGADTRPLNHAKFVSGVCVKKRKQDEEEECEKSDDFLCFSGCRSAYEAATEASATRLENKSNGVCDDGEVNVITVSSSRASSGLDVIDFKDDDYFFATENVLSPRDNTHVPDAKKKQELSLLNSETSAREVSSSCGSTSLDLCLSKEQKRVFDLVVKYGRSVFLTGGAGTGKSHLLRAIIAALPCSSTFVTATTGIAALNLGGTTLHSFAGCGIIDPQQHTPHDVFNTVRKKSKAKRNWRFCKVLVVDEVSMMDGWLLDVLEYVARMIRGSCQPFGGIQVVFAGDFLQLPPVAKQQDCRPRFCFESAAWCRINPFVCVLSEHFRQKDELFFKMLNEIRRGILTAPSLALLSRLSPATAVSSVAKDTKYIKAEGSDGSAVRLPRCADDETVVKNCHTMQKECGEFSILRALRSEVDTFNTRRFNELKSEIFSYKGFHTGEGHYPAELPAVVSLRVGCRVMLLKNIDVSLGLVNGSVGTVKAFVDGKKVREFSKKTVLYDLETLCTHALLPIVQFDSFGDSAVRKDKSNDDSKTAGCFGGGNKAGDNGGCEMLIEPHHWPVMQGDKEISCSVQIPLQLAYAITIHKSQGMSLARVNVDFKGIFEEGQAYVALSRCTDINNLVIQNFDAHRVNPNAKALAYYSALEEAKEMLEKEEDELYRASVRNPWGKLSVVNKVREVKKCKTFCSCEKYFGALGGAAYVEQIRQRITPFFSSWSVLRLRVLSSVVNAFSVQGALFVMDTSSLLILGSSIDFVDIYEKLFFKQQNMMRVPRVVKDELLRTATMYDMAVRTSPTVCLSFGSVVEMDVSSFTCAHEAAELAGSALCMMEDAKSDFVLDEQRDGESRALPPRLSQWHEELPHHFLSAGNWGDVCSQQDQEEQQLSILQFTCYLLEQYSSHQPVIVCTESIGLAARALTVGFRVCSLAYLCSK